MQKFFRIALFIYILLIIIAVIFPTQTIGITGMDETYVSAIRLDHLLHLAGFFPLYPMARIAFPPKNVKHRMLILILILVLAALTESLQLLISYRSFNIIDMLSNVSGVLFGYVFYVAFMRKSN
jgi:glycopeptide antibiotics resistance protein